MKINDDYKCPLTTVSKELEDFLEKLQADNPQLLELPTDLQIKITKAIWADLQD